MISELLAAQDGVARLEGEAGDGAGGGAGGAGGAAGDAGGGGVARASRELRVHPVDLALRAAGVTGSYAAAALGMRLASVLPAGLGRRRRRRIATWRRRWRWRGGGGGWRCAGGSRRGCRRRRCRRCRRWRGASRAGAERLSGEAVLRGAWLWREGAGRPPLPFWSAPVAMLHRLALAPTEAGVLAAIAAGGGGARLMLGRLRAVPEVAGRGRLAEARALALRRPVVTGRMLADGLG